MRTHDPLQTLATRARMAFTIQSARVSSSLQIEDSMPKMLLHHVSYPVRDVETSAAFYESLFGLTRRSRSPFPIPGVWLGCDDRQIHLVHNASGTYRGTASIDIADVH